MSDNTNLTSDPKTDPKIQAIQRLYAAVGRGDIVGVLDELAETVDWAAGAASSSAPWYGAHHGKDDVARFFKEIGSSIEITEFTPVVYTAGDADVMVPVRFAYTVYATGRSAQMTMQHWWHFEDGKVTFFRGAEDSEQTANAFR